MGFYEDMATVLGNAGLDASAIVPAITTVDYLALGSALDLTAPDDAWSARTTGSLFSHSPPPT